MEFKIGDIIRPAIIGRGIRSYIVTDIEEGLWVRRWNVTRRAPYGDEINLDLAEKQVWTLVRRLKGPYCPDNRNDPQRTDWTRKGWNHHP